MDYTTEQIENLGKRSRKSGKTDCKMNRQAGLPASKRKCGKCCGKSAGQWVFARKGEGYLALYIQQPFRWLADDAGLVNEIRVDAPDCIWLVELGDRTGWGSFDAFIQAVAAAALDCRGLTIRYQSPSQGEIAFGWEGDLRVRGEAVALHNYPRFDNPYCFSPFGADQVVVRRGEEQLVWQYPA